MRLDTRKPRRPERPRSSPPHRPARKPKEGEGRLRNLKLTIEYDGTRYHGWQIQAKQRTVAGTISQAIGDVIRERVNIYGAGRTDAGAHADGQGRVACPGATVDATCRIHQCSMSDTLGPHTNNRGPSTRSVYGRGDVRETF